MSKNESLLVTGASGHLGQLVLEALLKAGARHVIATTRTSEKPETAGEYPPRKPMDRRVLM